MRTLLIAFLMLLATRVGADCGKLCNYEWWEKATTADLKAELEAGADVKARNLYGYTPLHIAAYIGSPESVQILLEAGADANAKDEDGSTPWDLAQDNEILKGTKGYWALNDARFN